MRRDLAPGAVVTKVGGDGTLMTVEDVGDGTAIRCVWFESVPTEKGGPIKRERRRAVFLPKSLLVVVAAKEKG